MAASSATSASMAAASLAAASLQGIAVNPRADLDIFPKLAAFLEFVPGSRGAAQFEAALRGLWAMFTATDATLVEINPLAEAADGGVYVCDAKINFDDNASFRQKAIFAQRDHSQEDAREVEAAKWDLNYIGLRVSPPSRPAPPPN